MKKPLKVQGYHFNYEDGIKARDENKLLICGLETNYKCNLKCSYCAWGSGPQEEKTIDIKKLKVFLDNIKKKGGKSAVIVGGGEPTLYSDFKEFVKYISDIGMQPILITNGIAINDELAEFLNDKNCSIFLKADSFNEEVQDKLSGVSGMFKKNHEALLRLMKLGFNTVNSNNETRLAMSIVVNKQNINEVPDIWKFCRDNDIYPNLEILNLSSGRALENKEMLEVREKVLDEYIKLFEVLEDNHLVTETLNKKGYETITVD